MIYIYLSFWSRELREVSNSRVHDHPSKQILTASTPFPILSFIPSHNHINQSINQPTGRLVILLRGPPHQPAIRLLPTPNFISLHRPSPNPSLAGGRRPTMSEKKDCGSHRSYWRHRTYRRVFACILSFIILVLLVILVIWLVLRPTKPKFYLQDASISSFSVTSSTLPALLTSTIQVTITSRNPNDRIGIYYDRLDVYAEYKGQQITVPVGLPTGYQGHKDVTVWSPFLSGRNVPIAPYLADAIGQDVTAGFLLLHIKIDGRLRWKVGSWISGRYHINVNCPAFFTIAKANGGGATGFRFQQIARCTVDV